MGIPDGLQNKHPNNVVPISIRFGGRHAGHISDTQLTNSMSATTKRKGVGKDFVGNVVQARGTPDSHLTTVRVGAKATESIHGEA